MPDIEITCSSCREPFTLTEGEQQFLQKTFGADYKEPRRCKDCRKAKKEQPFNAPRMTRKR